MNDEEYKINLNQLNVVLPLCRELLMENSQIKHISTDLSMPFQNLTQSMWLFLTQKFKNLTQRPSNPNLRNLSIGNNKEPHRLSIITRVFDLMILIGFCLIISRSCLRLLRSGNLREGRGCRGCFLLLWARFQGRKPSGMVRCSSTCLNSYRWPRHSLSCNFWRWCMYLRPWSHWSQPCWEQENFWSQVSSSQGWKNQFISYRYPSKIWSTCQWFNGPLWNQFPSDDQNWYDP